MTVKRINLSFSLNRDEDLKVYKILSNQKFKTAYVIKAILYYTEQTKPRNNKEMIKEAVREVFEEYSLSDGIKNNGNKKENKNEKRKNDIDIEDDILPDEVFDVLNNL